MRAISDIRRNSMATAMENAGVLLQFEKMIQVYFFVLQVLFAAFLPGFEQYDFFEIV